MITHITIVIFLSKVQGGVKMKKEKDKRVNERYWKVKEYVILFIALAAFNGFHIWIYLTLEQKGIFGSNPRLGINLMMLYVLVSAALVTAIIGIIRYRSWTLPIKKVCEAARKIAKGDFTVRIASLHKDGRKDFVEELFNDFNSMTEELASTHKKLEEALKEAKAASDAKSNFLSHMSHEIRTPMNSIVGFSELAMDDEVPVKTKEYLLKIQESSQWLLQILNNILDISKIESGKMELEKVPFDLRELFAACRTIVMPKAVEKGLTLHFYAEPSINKRRLLGDPTRLRQALLNLMTNAIKFTDAGIVKLSTEVKDKGEKTLAILFEVKDSGIGMTEEQKGRIFDPYTQAEAGTTRKYGGTGLGLSITKNIVEMMGGTLVVESAPGAGSKFSFTLTFDTLELSNEDIAKKEMALNNIERPIFEGEVLLCEDMVMNQQIICEHLAKVGIKTVVAENGKIGVEMVQSRMEKGEKQFDLIFMDMRMPVMDGIEAAEKILELNTGVPIVAMTANIMSNEKDLYVKSGMSDCLGKPFTSQELWHCLMRYFTPKGK